MNTEQARFNMIHQQIQPCVITTASVIRTLQEIKREDFVPHEYRDFAFTDMQIPIVPISFPQNEDPNDSGSAVWNQNTEVMLSPILETALLASIDPVPGGYALEVGAGSGYFAALLSSQGFQVLTKEIRPEIAEIAKNNIEKASIKNVFVETTDGFLPGEEEVFDLIVLSGSVPFIPYEILSQLKIKGQILSITGDFPVMSAKKCMRSTVNTYQVFSLFETYVPPLRGFPGKKTFRL